MNNWKHWLYGAVSAAVGAAAGGISVVVVDPNDFNLSTGLAKLGKVCLVNALVALGMYLKQKPLPDDLEPPTQPPAAHA